MKINRFIFSALAGLVLLVSACAPQATPTAAPPTQPVAATSAPAMGTTVQVGKNDALGSFLVDDKGMTLYLFTKDSPNTTTCYDQCATNWPPLLTTSVPVAGEGVDASNLATITRTDGMVQVTYNGWPLYFYAKDAAPGDVVGQNVGDVWFVVSPAGEQVMAP